ATEPAAYGPGCTSKADNTSGRGATWSGVRRQGTPPPSSPTDSGLPGEPGPGFGPAGVPPFPGCGTPPPGWSAWPPAGNPVGGGWLAPLPPKPPVTDPPAPPPPRLPTDTEERGTTTALEVADATGTSLTVKTTVIS